MLVQTSPYINASFRLPDSPSKKESLPLTRSVSVKRIRQGMGIKGLLQCIESTANPIVLRQPKKTPTNLPLTISTTNSPKDLKPSISDSVAFPELKDLKSPQQLSLREKRLNDIQSFRTRSEREIMTPKGGLPGNFKPSLGTSLARISSLGTRTSSTVSLRKRRNLRLSHLAPQENISGTFSLDMLSKEQDSASPISTHNASPILNAISNSKAARATTIQIHEASPENSPKAADSKMLELKLLSDSHLEVSTIQPEGRLPSSMRRSASTALHLKRRRTGRSPTFATEGNESPTFSAALLSHGYSSINESPIFTEGSVYSRLGSPQEDIRVSTDEWKQYSEKANSKMPKLKFRAKKKREVYIPEGPTELDPEKVLQSIKPIYADFITEKFDKKILERINTFNAFGFTRNEKIENQEINMFFNDINNGRDITGTMCMVDLWSLQQRKDVAKKAKYEQEKHRLEKFAFYTSEQQKKLVPIKTERIKQPKATDDMDKHKYAMLELKKSAEKNQEYALMSPMRRHRDLMGKFFHDPKEVTLEEQEAVKNMNELNMEMGTLMEGLKRFEEENQEDYVKFLKYIKGSKKKEVSPKDKASQISTIKQYRSIQPKPSTGKISP